MYIAQGTVVPTLFPFPVNLGSTRAYDSAMEGNASTGLGSADHHSSRDMKSMEADDRPTNRDEDTNRKSLFPATKTLHNWNYEMQQRVLDETFDEYMIGLHLCQDFLLRISCIAILTQIMKIG